MDQLWSPWRYSYIQGSTPTSGCLFCEKARSREDEANLVVHRGEFVFALLNLYPYSVGHLMIAPYAHVPTLVEVNSPAAAELIHMAQQAERVLDQVYRPAGYNMGFNIGSCAGAGVAGHLHFHIVPRWPGDANFMTTIGETRVLPEDLGNTYRKVAAGFRSAPHDTAV